MRKFFTLALFLNIYLFSYAQAPKIDTDRPDQTESAFLVPKGWFQFELGLTMQEIVKGQKEYELPTLLSKYGLSKRIELRLITANIHDNGLAPVEIGTRIALTEENKWMPKTSLLMHIGFPKFASKKLQLDKLAPNFRISCQHTITNHMSLGYNLGAEWDGFNNEAGWIYTLSPGFDISEKWYGYIEAFGVITKLDAPQHNIDGGFAYCVSPNFKIDLSSGFGISDAAPAWYLSAGASIRFK
jgi:hypothetical protein